MKFNIVTYIKPSDTPGDFSMFATSLINVQKSQYLNKLIISFVDELSDNFKKELDKYKNIIWKDNVDEYWAQEIKTLINQNPSDYYYIWEEDSHIFDIKEFDNSFKSMVENSVECLITQDLKWIKRAEHLLNNEFAIDRGNHLIFNWGTYYAKYCRESSNDSLVNGAYPVTVSSIFTKKLLLSLLDNFMSSTHWVEITKGNFSHYHNNPKIPHSFEVYPGFWWEGGPNRGCGEVEYITMVSKTQFAEELGERLIDKLRKDTINIVGYDDWYTEKPWCREEINNKEFKITYNQNSTDLTYFIKDGIYKAKEITNPKTKVALLTECRIMDPVRYKFVEDNHNLFDYIVTYDDQLISKFKEKVIITPYGGTWVWPKEVQKVLSKSKICSYITSNKTYTVDQKMRISLLNYYQNNPQNNIELFGRGHNPLPENHEAGDYDGKVIALKDYAFSLVIENHVQDNYFSEKLLDCLLTGTIPIYHGCKKISEYFNMDGFILFDTEEEVKNIIKNLSIEKYNKKINAVKENYKIAKKYRDSVQFSFNKIKKKIENNSTEIVNLSSSDPKTTVDGYIQDYWLNQFFTKGGDHSHLYTFDLNEDSIVFDVGAFEGEYFTKIYDKYKCNIHAFEPVTSFVEKYKNTTNPKIIVNGFALGDSTEDFEIVVDDNSSSQFIKGDNTIKCKKVKFREYINSQKLKNIDLIKLNIEGAEYELLEEIIDSEFQDKIDGFLIQFHYLSHTPIKRREKIINKLKETHEPVFYYPFVWEYWKKK